MKDLSKMVNFIFLIIYIVFISCTRADISDLRACADPSCNARISRGRTTQMYFPKENDILSFNVDEDVAVYSKEAGKNQDLWGVEVMGKRGYIPKKFIKEEKIFVKKSDLRYIVSTGILDEKELNQSDTSSVESNVNSNDIVGDQTVSKHTQAAAKEQEGLAESSSSSLESINSSSEVEDNIAIDKGKEDNIEVQDAQLKSKSEADTKESTPILNEVAQGHSKEPLDAQHDVNIEPESLSDEPKKEAIEVNKNDKINLDVKNDISKNEEMDNEDEGNGNEGEENGSEYSVKETSSDEEKVIGDSIPSTNVDNAQTTSEAKEKEETKVTSDDETLPAITDPVVDKSSVVPLSKESPPAVIPDPTPRQYEVVDGTTVYIDDSDIFQSSSNSGNANTHSLEASSEPHDSHTTEPTIPMSKLRSGSIKKMSPLLEKTFNHIITEEAKDNSPPVLSLENTERPENSHEDDDDTPPENIDDQSSTDAENKEESTDDRVSEDILNEKTATKDGAELRHDTDDSEEPSEFSTLKPETVIEDESIVPIQNQEDLPEEIPASPEDLPEESSSSWMSSFDILTGILDTGTPSAAPEPSSKSNNDQDGREPTSRKDSLLDNLAFIDPDMTLTEESLNAEGVDEEREKRDVEGDDGLSQGTSKDGHDIQSIKEKLLDASGSVLQWILRLVQFNEGMSLAIEGELAHPRLSTGTVTFLFVVAGTIVVLYLSHLIIVKLSRESPLLEMMNNLDRNQRVLTEENNNLKRQLSNTNGQIKSANFIDHSSLQELRQQFELNEKSLVDEIEDIRERNLQLEGDLEASTTNEMELHRMLDELLSSQRETSNFEDSVNNLQKMLDGQREIVESLTSDLALKTRLNEELRNELKSSRSKVSKLEYQIEQLTLSLEEVSTSKQQFAKKLGEEELSLHSLKEMNDALRQEVDKVSKDSQHFSEESQRLLQEVKRLKQRLHNKEAECQISKECLKRLHAFTDGGGNDIQGKVAELFKIIEVKTELSSVSSERAELQHRLKESETRLFSLSEELKNLQTERTQLRESSDSLQKERNEAVSKLGVLSQYYEEKEAQLKKALESQEGLLHSAEGSANLVSGRFQTYEMELASCRSQIESLKKELEEEKQSYKIQLTNEERKLHDTWLTARAAERRQEELRQENSQLRQKLTQMQRDSEHKNMLIKPSPKRVDANGSVSSPVSLENDLDHMHPSLPHLDLDGSMPLPPPPPPLMSMFPGRPPLPPGLPPLPPHLFGPLPPPPHHPPMPDRRLPPAGRIASPPGYDRRSYSPESDRSPYSDQRYSPGIRYSPNNPRAHSPDRKSDHLRRNPNPRRYQRSPSPINSTQIHSPPERWYNQSPVQGKYRRASPMDYYDPVHESRKTNHAKGKKTSTPLGPNDR